MATYWNKILCLSLLALAVACAQSDVSPVHYGANANYAAGAFTLIPPAGTATSLTAGNATSYRVYPVSVPNIMTLGDSQTYGSNGLYTGLVGGWPSYMVQQLRQWRGDFELVASQVALPELSAGSSVVWNEGHSGYTLSQLTTNLPTYVTSAGMPDIFIVMAGVNDITSGASAATVEASWSSLYSAIQTANANALTIALAPPPFVAGTTVSTNLAAWNAVQSAFNAWLSGTFATANSAHVIYSGCAQGLTPGDRLPDGVHPSQTGEAALGECVATQLDQIMGVRRGPVQQTSFRAKQPWAAEQTFATTDGLSLTAHTGVNPGSGSFTIAFDLYPTSLPSGTNSILSYGSYAVNNYYGILQVGNAVRVYWDNTAGTIGNTTATTFSEQSLVVGRWHRIVVMADAVHGVVALYVNAKLAGLATGVGAWTNTQQTLTMGKDATFGSGVPGYYGRLWTAKAVAAKPGTEAALNAVEADYYLGDSLAPGQATASFSVDGILSDDVYAPGDPNPSLVAVGGTAASSAFPSGTPLRPWEGDALPRDGSLYGLTSGNLIRGLSTGLTPTQGAAIACSTGGTQTVPSGGSPGMAVTAGTLTSACTIAFATNASSGWFLLDMHTVTPTNLASFPITISNGTASFSITGAVLTSANAAGKTGFQVQTYGTNTLAVY